MTTVLDRKALRVPPARTRVAVEDDEHGWRCEVAHARDAARLRHAFRDYLEAYGHPASDFQAAEAIFGELATNCAHHAPGPLQVEFRWSDTTLVVVDRCDRLRTWPYSPEDVSAEATHVGYTIVSALSARVVLAREPGGGTRATVVLPLAPASLELA